MTEETKSGETFIRMWVNGAGDKLINISSSKQKVAKPETPKEEKK